MTPFEILDAHLERITRDRPRLFAAVQVWILARLVGWAAFSIWLIVYAYQEISAMEGTLGEIGGQLAGLWPVWLTCGAVVAYAIISDRMER